ncbi:hypothetical protein B0A54_01812 [Friedmanniomyces endolithicus]|uniref:G-protein coupled receptors family 2 profile 2 domain-containing protein n=1 Tax=Friedmanniomyces endolithicus TaxID=329885 RepID=A0A4U0VED5_9PEZI|nr:hypothetical protein LTS09_014795 [Friedmanniomyces endolithicus]TKA47441.1 hypothetical protein B0A54_01812 [Friedmanniomyces endolithicus]
MGYGSGGGGPPVGLQFNVTSCPAPFIDASLFPPTGGDISARFCAAPAPGLICCLPCPISDWVFSDKFAHQASSANYVGILTLILNSILLLTYVVLPEEKSHRHYLSIGLTLSLILLSIAFIIPLGTKPDECFNEITPDNMHTDMSCAWTGALFSLGFMGAVVWILLRSIWTALRIVFDFKRTELFKWVSISLGVGLPILFLVIVMPVAGVSYRLYNVCIPNGQAAFNSWFIWLLLFSALSTVILILTILYCLWKFALSALAKGRGGGAGFGHVSSTSQDTTSSTGMAAPGSKPTVRAVRRKKRVEWARIKRVLYLQWRTILLAFVVLNETIFFGLVFVQQTAAIEQSSRGITASDAEWGLCLIETGGDMNACLPLSGGLGLSEPRVVATLLLAATLGIIVFLLMLRSSMFTGWYELMRNPRQLLKLFNPRRPSVGSQDFIMQGSPKHISLNIPLGSEEIERPLQSPNTQTRHALGLDQSVSGRGEHDLEEAKLHDEESLDEKGLRHEDKVLV